MSRAAEYIFIGGLREDYCITPDQQIISGTLGGNAVYSAVGARVWTDSVGIVSRIGNNYPMGWLDQLQKHGIDTRQIKKLEEPHSSVTFYAYLSLEERVDTNPIMHFARIGEPMPRELVGYKTSTSGQDSRSTFFPLSVRPHDIDDIQHELVAAHLAPAEFLTHITLPYYLRSKCAGILSLDPSLRYMTPDFKFDLPKILLGVDAFLPSEMEAKSFFAPRTPGTWEMAEQFSETGCRFVVIKQGARGQAVFDRDNKQRWMIPAYPAKVRDVTGAGDSFCGGFIVGLAQTGDPVEAALWGSVSASLTIEGTGALYALGTTPGLATSRLRALRSRVSRV